MSRKRPSHFSPPSCYCSWCRARSRLVRFPHPQLLLMCFQANIISPGLLCLTKVISWIRMFLWQDTCIIHHFGVSFRFSRFTFVLTCRNKFVVFHPVPLTHWSLLNHLSLSKAPTTSSWRLSNEENMIHLTDLPISMIITPRQPLSSGYTRHLAVMRKSSLSFHLISLSSKLSTPIY